VHKLGLLLHAARCDAADELLATRGEPVCRRNRIRIVWAGDRVTDTMDAIARLQLIGNRLFSDLPLTCKSSTFGRFGGRLSLSRLSLQLDF
jgi:hypothetical protein